jgi:hypothetical protein
MVLESFRPRVQLPSRLAKETPRLLDFCRVMRLIAPSGCSGCEERRRGTTSRGIRMMDTQRKVAAVILVVLAGGVGLTVGVWPGPQMRGKVEAISTDLPKHEGERKIDNSLRAREANAVAPVLPKFIGYLTSGSDTLFALSLPPFDGGINSTGFIKIGQTFGEYRIVGFDRGRELLLLKSRAGDSFEIAVVEGKVVETEEQLRRRMRELIDTSTRAIRDIHTPVAVPRK